GGVVRNVCAAVAVAVPSSLLASLLVAFTPIRVLVSCFLQRRASWPAEHRDWLHRAYQPVLGWALANRLTMVAVLAIAGVLFAGAIGAVASPLVAKNFFDFSSSEQLVGGVTLPPGTSAAETSAQLKAFETAAMADRDVQTVQVTIRSRS